MFLGTHSPRLDDKGRLFLPAKFRDELAEGVVITKGQERCLYVFPMDEFVRVADTMRGFGWHVTQEDVVPGRPNVVAVIHGERAGRTLMFEGHTDVVTEGNRADWSFPPFAGDIVDGLQKSLSHSAKSTGASIHKGHDAAKAIIALMDRTATRIPPVKLVDTFVEEGGQTTVAVQDELWDRWGKATVATMADGAKVLAAIWQAAWKAGSGGSIAQADLGPVDPKALVKLYTDRKFVESLDIDDIGPALG